MKYALKLDSNYVVEAKEVKKDTVIKSETYGDILVTKGNYILTLPDKSQVGCTPSDLELQYQPVK